MAPAAAHIIDDDEAVRDSIAALLETNSLPVVTYASGPAFLAALPGGARGCVVADLRMPGMDGLELLRRLKTRGAAPVAIITARHGRAITEEALAEGAFAVLEKPFAAGAFLTVVRAALALDRPI